MLTSAERKTADEASKQLSDYFLSIIRNRQGEPRDDIMTRLVQAEEQGDTLSETEMLNMLRLLLIAGNETTTNLIGNGMLALLRHPDQLQSLRDDPGLIPTAVDELLRYDSPVQMTLRCAVEDCDIDGVPVRAGQDMSSCWAGRPTATPMRSKTRINWISNGRNRITFHSAGVFITVWEPVWPVSKDASHWRCCSNGSTRYACSPIVRRSATASCCAGLSPCRLGDNPDVRRTPAGCVPGKACSK